MPNNPVQIILNDQDFHQAPDPGQPPRNKDFFENADQAFAEHKRALLSSIDAIVAALRASPYGPLAYLKVQMRNEALAKSYRPVWWLFKADQFPCVGADAVGTLYFEAPLIYLPTLRRRMCASVGIEGVTPHTLRHTFASVAGDLGFSELTIRALLGHGSQSVTQDYIHIDEALKLAIARTCEEVASLLDENKRTRDTSVSRQAA